MKKINIFLSVLFITTLFIGCDSEEEAEVFENRDISGASIAIDGYGSIVGDQAGESIAITSSVLHMEIDVDKEEDSTIVSQYELVKQYKGGEEISVGTYESLPFTVDFTEIDQFLEGTAVSEEDLKIGDEFTFTVKVHQTDGDVYRYARQSFNIAVNCFADVAGMYAVTNSVCGEGETGDIPLVEITSTPDGKWKLATADGGLLQYCTSNTGLVNSGTISIICGEVQASDNVDYCGSDGVGCITGGTWDEETGTLVLNLNDDLFGNGAYTATYVKQ